VEGLLDIKSMKSIAIIMTIAMMATSVVANDIKENTSHAQWLTSCYEEILTIKPGMERKDLDSLFTPDGGISFRMAQTFLYKKANIIKIHVRFHMPDNTDLSAPYDPHDLIESVSYPFLEYPTGD
jgi:hypothetical protein